ncbi:Uncharacterised protein [Bordetella pertussis]|nr:Uncharacterised protein [Bordetella pertussis]
MASARALAIRASFCGVLKTQRRLSSTGSTILALAATLIIGTLASAATSTMASEPGVIEVPTSTSTLSSEASLREFFTACVVSVASSSTIHSILVPSTSLGSRATVLRSGMPSEAAGPVAAIVTPTLTWALAISGRLRATAAATADKPKCLRMFCLLCEPAGAPGMERGKPD